MMFRSLALLSVIALFSSAAAQNVWQVTVGNAIGNTIYTPNNIVSQVLTAQPNHHTDNLPSRVHQLEIPSNSHSIPRIIA